MADENKLVLLERFFVENNISYTEEILKMFHVNRQLILEWNEKVNLTAIKDLAEFELKHFIDSVAICLTDEMKQAESVIDVGTGAGFPGIPLAILYPEKKFVLMDSLGKRIKILAEVCRQIGIDNVELVHARAEELAKQKEHREQYDLCVSRAVANLAVLSEYCLPFVKVGGCFAAYKTSEAQGEINESTKAISILGGRLKRIVTAPVEGIQNHQIAMISKEKSTAAKYPRKAGTPSKEPLK